MSEVTETVARERLIREMEQAAKYLISVGGTCVFIAPRTSIKAFDLALDCYKRIESLRLNPPPQEDDR